MTRLRCTFPRVLLPTARRHYSVMPPDGAVGAHGREGRRNGAPESGERETLKSQNNDAEAHPAGLPALSAGNTSASRRTTLLGEPGPGRGHGVPRFRLAPEYGDHLGQSILSAAADLKDGNEEAGYEEATPPPVRQLLLNPRIIRGHLDTHVVGQERLKRTMATAVYNHYVRIESNMPKPEYEPTLEADFRTYTKIPRKPSFSHPINRVVRHDERDKVTILELTSNGMIVTGRITLPFRSCWKSRTYFSLARRDQARLLLRRPPLICCKFPFRSTMRPRSHRSASSRKASIKVDLSFGSPGWICRSRCGGMYRQVTSSCGL